MNGKKVLRYIIYTLTAGCLLLQPLYAATTTLTPVAEPMENYNNLKNAINGAQPGDIIELLGIEGVPFNLSNGIKFNSKNGTASQPIIMRAAPGTTPVIQVTFGGVNIIEINNSSFVQLKGIEVTQLEGNQVSDVIAIRINNSNNVTIEDCHVHHVGNSLINVKSGDNYGHKFINNYLHHTGAPCNPGDTNYSCGEGEAMYLGCNTTADCIFRDSEVRGNIIHDTRGTQGDGIEIKSPGYNNIVAGNVISATNYPGVLIYGCTNGSQGWVDCATINESNRNIIEKNIVYSGKNSGMQIDGAALVQNNLVFSNQLHGIQSRSNPGGLKYLEISHNTLIDNKGNNLDLRNWFGKTGMALTNNVSYQTGLLGSVGQTHYFDTAIVNLGDVAGNVVYSTSGPVSGFTNGNGASDFIDLAGFDFTPSATSVLIAAADNVYAASDDLFGFCRDDAAADSGALEYGVSTICSSDGPENPFADDPAIPPASAVGESGGSSTGNSSSVAANQAQSNGLVASGCGQIGDASGQHTDSKPITVLLVLMTLVIVIHRRHKM